MHKSVLFCPRSAALAQTDRRYTWECGIFVPDELTYSRGLWPDTYRVASDLGKPTHKPYCNIKVSLSLSVFRRRGVAHQGALYHMTSWRWCVRFRRVTSLLSAIGGHWRGSARSRAFINPPEEPYLGRDITSPFSVLQSNWQVINAYVYDHFTNWVVCFGNGACGTLSSLIIAMNAIVVAALWRRLQERVICNHGSD